MKRYEVNPEEQLKVEAEMHSASKDATNNEKKEKIRETHIKYLKRLWPKSNKILCLGARDDSEVMTFKRNGYKAVGLDVCNETNLIQKGDAHKLKELFKPHQFHLVYASHCLEHMYDPHAVLEGIRHVAKYGAFVILPLPWKTGEAVVPSVNHPTIFDIMLADVPHTDGVTWELLLDFAKMEPFKLCHYRRRELGGLPYDVELGFRFVV